MEIFVTLFIDRALRILDFFFDDLRNSRKIERFIQAKDIYRVIFVK